MYFHSQKEFDSDASPGRYIDIRREREEIRASILFDINWESNLENLYLCFEYQFHLKNEAAGLYESLRTISSL